MSAQSDVIAPLLDAVGAAAGHAAAIVRFVDQVEGESTRPLGAHDRTAVALVVSAASILAEQAGITSDDLPGRSRSLGVADLGGGRDKDSEVPPSDAGDGHPAAAAAEGGDDVVLDGLHVLAGDHDGVSIDHELVVRHDASPSAGESAERGDASTLSVGGEPAAGARNVEAPAATPAGRYSRTINPAALRSIRELAGVRSGDLASAAGISHGFLSNIEAGRKAPSPSVLHALAKRLGVPLDAITQIS